MAIFHGPMDPLEFWPRGSSNPHGPQTIGHTNDQKTPNNPKRPLITIPSKKAMAMARTQNTEEVPKWPNFKDNGDKPSPWRIPKANKGEEEPRGTISQ
ncbi:hypothetical protein O181_032355 [Austropuccinia psidii MF-1]|uniref:Uncharacterized protein n=1 Tax=Austropuccinia psidii MF-1 TaxID=1389203 RepID=A0A9Q3H853_9BASI|nr:hypothetical protein [Austropuccinia psidii MF-1]